MTASGHRAEQHVGRLHVTVDQPGGVGRIERGRDLADNGARARRVHRAGLAEQRPNVAAADIAHCDEQDAVRLARLEDRDHVRMVNGGSGPRLADEPLPERLIAGDLGRQDLQRHPAV